MVRQLQVGFELFLQDAIRHSPLLCERESLLECRPDESFSKTRGESAGHFPAGLQEPNDRLHLHVVMADAHHEDLLQPVPHVVCLRAGYLERGSPLQAALLRAQGDASRCPGFPICSGAAGVADPSPQSTTLDTRAAAASSSDSGRNEDRTDAARSGRRNARISLRLPSQLVGQHPCIVLLQLEQALRTIRACLEELYGEDPHQVAR